MRPSQRGLVALLAFAGVAVGLGGWAVVAGLGARADLLTVQSAVQQLRQDAPSDSAELRAGLTPAAEAADRARARLSRPGPALVARLPVLGEPLAAERDVAIIADLLLGSGLSVLDSAERLKVDGGVDVDLLSAIAVELRTTGAALQAPLSRLESSRLRLIPAGARTAIEQAREELGGLDRRLQETAQAGDALAGLLGADGQRNLVVVLMNNAELRGAGGYGGSFALVRTDRGRVSVGAFQDVNEVEDSAEQAQRVEAPGDYAARWGPYLANTTLWKNTLMSADQSASAAVTCRVVRLAPGVPCDAVVLIDIPALARLVQLGGPVDLGGGEAVTGDELVRALLVEAYADVADTPADQAERRLRLRQAADSAVSDLLNRSITGLDALRVLGQGFRGRHIAVWSTRQEEQDALLAAGLTGDVHPGSADLNLVSVNQLSAGKLDYYVTRSVGLHAVVDDDEVEVTQKVSLALDAPAGLPRYVLGVRDGRLEELMDIAVPRAARDIVLKRDGEPVPAPLTEESGSLRVVVEVVLRAGEKATWEVSYRLPAEDGRYRLRLLPQPLARDAVLHLAVVAAPGRRLAGGEVIYDGPYEAARTVDVRLAG